MVYFTFFNIEMMNITTLPTIGKEHPRKLHHFRSIVTSLLFSLLGLFPAYKAFSQNLKPEISISLDTLHINGKRMISLSWKDFEETKQLFNSVLKINDSIDISTIRVADPLMNVQTSTTSQEFQIIGSLKPTSGQYGDKLSDIVVGVSVSQNFANNVIQLSQPNITYASLEYHVSTDWTHMILNDLMAYEISWMKASLAKQQMKTLVYDKEKTTDLIKAYVSKQPFALDINYSLLKDLPPLMKHIDIASLLKSSLVLDKSVQKKSENEYFRQLMIKDGSNFKVLKEIPYLFDDEAVKVTLSNSLPGTYEISILWYHLPITLSVENNRLLIRIEDADVLKFKEHIIASFNEAWSTLNATTLGNFKEFKNLNKIAIPQWVGKPVLYSYDPNATGLSLVTWFGTNIRDTRTPFLISFFPYAHNDNHTTSESNISLELVDDYNTPVLSHTVSDPSTKTFRELSLSGKWKGNLFGISEHKGKVSQYSYLSFEGGYGKQLTSAIKSFGGDKLTLVDPISQETLTSFFVKQDAETWYSYDQERNKVNLQSEYFYHLLPSIYPTVSSKLNISNSQIRQKFDYLFGQAFPDKEKTNIDGLVISGKYYRVQTEQEGTHLFISEIVPNEVVRIIDQLKTLISQMDKISYMKLYYSSVGSTNIQKSDPLDHFISGTMGAGFVGLEWFDTRDPSSENTFTYLYVSGDDFLKLEFKIKGTTISLITQEVVLWDATYLLSLKDRKWQLWLFVSPTKKWSN